MSVAEPDNLAPRPSAKPLLWALLISLIVHLVALVVIPFVYIMLVVLAIIAKPPDPAQLQQKQNPQETLVELPLQFVEVDPTQAVKDAPKDAKYYSSQNAKAANPDASLEKDKPKIDGKQTHVMKTETAQKPKAFPLQPSPPKPPAPESKPETKPQGGPKIGDLAMAKPAEKPGDNQTDAQVGQPQPRPRPRTLAEAEAQKMMLGEKIKQDGGVKQRRISASFDTKATAFGAYDAAFIDAVTKHWYDLVDSQHNSEMHTGRVILEFNLNYNGTISDMKVIEGDASGIMTLLCEEAILDPAPYEKWPSDMRRLIGSNQREVRFTFYYE